jgi:hypothetical protein
VRVDRGSIVYFRGDVVLELGIEPAGIVPRRNGPWVCVGMGALFSRWAPITTRRGTVEARDIPPSAWVSPPRGKLYRSAIVVDASIGLRNVDLQVAADGIDRIEGLRPAVSVAYLRSLGVLALSAL